MGQYEAPQAFWEEIRDYALTKVPLPAVEPKLIRAKPMTDAQAREFEKERVPMGILKDRRVGDVMALREVPQLYEQSGPEYLKWLADQTFIDDLRRYLANETVARQ